MKKMRMCLWKKSCAAVLAACVTFGGLSAAVPGSGASAEETTMGRYLETDVALPEGFRIRDIVRTAEGTLRMVGQDADDVYTILDSPDGGASWKQTGAIPADAGDYFTEIRLNPNGGGAAVSLEEISDPGEEASGDSNVSTEPAEFLYYMISFDTEGNVVCRKDLEADCTWTPVFAQNGQLLAYEPSGEVYALDAQTCEVTEQIAEGADIIGTCGGEVLVLTDTELQQYDFTTGEPLTRDEALDDALYASASSHAYAISMSEVVPIAMAEDEEGRLYYCTQDGIFAHAPGGSVVERVVDGTLGTLGSPSTGLCALAVLDQCFYVACQDGKDKKLLKYEYSADIASVPERELTVWSLQETNEISQLAVRFQKLYPDTYVNYEVGMSGESGVTESDALRTLNTEILAGSGPDILVMDQLSVDTYAEQGLLTDLSGVLDDARAEDDLFENVTDVYERDGMLPAVPTRFGIVMMAGNSELLAEADGTNYAQTLEKLAPEPDALGVYDVISLHELMYYTSAGTWKKEDGTLDAEKLAEYVNGVAQTRNAWLESGTENAEESLAAYRDSGITDWKTIQGMGGIHPDTMAMGVMDLLTKPGQVKPGALYSLYDYTGITSVSKETGECAIVLPGVSGEKFFVPCAVLGVTGTSKEPERALQFVQYALSAQGQEETTGEGIPVNRTALKALMDGKSMEGGFAFSMGDEYISFEYVSPTQEEWDALIAMAEQVTTPVEQECVQHATVIGEMNRFLNGEISADETVNSIMQKINLYLAE